MEVMIIRELRCSNKKCGSGKPKLLGMSEMRPGSILEIKCPRCKQVTEFRAIDLPEAMKTEQH
jgi:phage FluMu protein Com